MAIRVWCDCGRCLRLLALLRRVILRLHRCAPVHPGLDNDEFKAYSESILRWGRLGQVSNDVALNAVVSSRTVPCTAQFTRVQGSALVVWPGMPFPQQPWFRRVPFTGTSISINTGRLKTFQ